MELPRTFEISFGQAKKMVEIDTTDKEEKLNANGKVWRALFYVEDVHGTRDICEINGLYSDGVCTLLPDCLQEDPQCIVEEEAVKACY